MFFSHLGHRQMAAVQTVGYILWIVLFSLQGPFIESELLMRTPVFKSLLIAEFNIIQIIPTRFKPEKSVILFRRARKESGET